jgi:hypothetical protein
MVPKLVFLGHLINQGTISPNPEQFTVTEQLKPPKDQKSCSDQCVGCYVISDDILKVIRQ